jgi:hypothetical protein
MLLFIPPPLPRCAVAWPVRRDSIPAESWRWPPPVSKRAAVKTYHLAREYDRQTGALGLAALAVLHGLLFDCYDHRTGRCDPSGATLATRANVNPATVWRALARLEAAGIIRRHRRCGTGEDGCRRQLTNAYVIRDPAHWAGFKHAPDPPAPEAGTWGDHPPLTDADVAPDRAAKIAVWQADADRGDSLARALAVFGRAINARQAPV